MLYFAPRNKASTTFYAWMVELVDTTDLKSVDPKGRAGSSPAPGTKREIAGMRSPVFGLSIRIEHLITPSAPHYSHLCNALMPTMCPKKVYALPKSGVWFFLG